MNRATKKSNHRTGTAAASVAARLVTIVLGLALALAGLSSALTARAASDLTVTATPGGNDTVTVTSTQCAEARAGAVFTVYTKAGEDITGILPLDGYDASAAFSFDWLAPGPGDYVVKVTCLSYNGSATQTGSAAFTMPGPVLTVTPTTWRAGDKVTISVTGLSPEDEFEVDLVTDPAGAKPVAVWLTTVDATGLATITVTWPKAQPVKASSAQAGTTPLAPGKYLLIAGNDSLGTKLTLSLKLGTDGLWDSRKPVVTPPPGGGGGGGKPPVGGGGNLPDTGA